VMVERLALVSSLADLAASHAVDLFARGLHSRSLLN